MVFHGSAAREARGAGDSQLPDASMARAVHLFSALPVTPGGGMCKLDEALMNCWQCGKFVPISEGEVEDRVWKMRDGPDVHSQGV